MAFDITVKELNQLPKTLIKYELLTDGEKEDVARIVKKITTKRSRVLK